MQCCTIINNYYTLGMFSETNQGKAQPAENTTGMRQTRDGILHNSSVDLYNDLVCRKENFEAHMASISTPLEQGPEARVLLRTEHEPRDRRDLQQRLSGGYSAGRNDQITSGNGERTKGKTEDAGKGNSQTTDNSTTIKFPFDTRIL